MTPKGGKPNTGQLMLQKSGYAARVWVVTEGVKFRRTIKLGTDIKAVAKIKLRELLADPSSVPTAGNDETYAQLARRVADRRQSQITDWKNEESRERLWVLPHIGALAVAQVKPHHISAIYENARQRPQSRIASPRPSSASIAVCRGA